MEKKLKNMNNKIYYTGLIFHCLIGLLCIIPSIIFSDYLEQYKVLLRILQFGLMFMNFNIFCELSIITKDYKYF